MNTENPDGLNALVEKWSFPYRFFVRSSFFRGLTLSFDVGTDLERAYVSRYYYSQLVANGGALYDDVANLTQHEAERRLHFVEQFLSEIRRNELVYLFRYGVIANVAGLVCAVLAMTCFLLLIGPLIASGSVVETVAAVMLAYVLYFSAVLKRESHRRKWNAAMGSLNGFREELADRYL